LEICFYYTHRLFHHPKLYRRFHKQHHLFTKPYGWTAIYCGLGELLIVNHLSVSLGPALTGMRGVSLALWFFMVGATTVLSHSGLGWDYSGGSWRIISPKHDLHHRYFNCNYGIFDILDRLHSTHYKSTPRD
jgi:methylsterol monooxygenase